jgi:hypothetical protein
MGNQTLRPESRNKGLAQAGGRVDFGTLVLGYKWNESFAGQISQPGYQGNNSPWHLKEAGRAWVSRSQSSQVEHSLSFASLPYISFFVCVCPFACEKVLFWEVRPLRQKAQK